MSQTAHIALSTSPEAGYRIPVRASLSVLTGCLVLCSACVRLAPEQHSGDQVLAQVYDQQLTLADIRPLLSDVTTKEDSVSLVRNHVETWVRETLLLHEAEKNIPMDVNINKLVQDYRASLLLSNYENVLVKTLLDTVVTEGELRNYYERNKDQYRLDVPILRIYYARIPKPVPQGDQFRRLWRSDRPADLEALETYCRQHAGEYLLEDSTWYRQPDIERILPPGSLRGQNMYPGRTFRFTDSENEYHLRVRQRVLNNEIAPLSYVSEQARRYILHKRKNELLEKIKADLYEREIKGDQVKIHI